MSISGAWPRPEMFLKSAFEFVCRKPYFWLGSDFSSDTSQYSQFSLTVFLTGATTGFASESARAVSELPMGAADDAAADEFTTGTGATGVSAFATAFSLAFALAAASSCAL